MGRNPRKGGSLAKDINIIDNIVFMKGERAEREDNLAADRFVV